MVKRNTQIKKIEKVIIPLLKKNNVVQAGIFGSFARREQNKRSDIDILIRFKGDKSLLEIVRMERELKRKVGRKVDLITYRSLHPFLKDRILKEEIRIL